jgi:hypothetical protein
MKKREISKKSPAGGGNDLKKRFSSIIVWAIGIKQTTFRQFFTST